MGRGDEAFLVRCRSAMELGRAEGFETKEPGTVAWIRECVAPGDVFVDIGANMGLYGLLAARRAGPAGRVYAFEPHLPTAAGLLMNVALNGLAERVQVLSVALHDAEGYAPFDCSSIEEGSSFHQVRGGDRSSFAAPAGALRATELKHTTTLDLLVERGVVLPPDHVKLDVDGNEPRILAGMRRLLGGTRPPRTVQVELDPASGGQVTSFLSGLGYRRATRHETAHGARSIAQGADPASVAHNVIFRRG